MRVTFTGTRHGMTTEQWATVEDILTSAFGDGGVFRDGDCLGADEQANATAWRIKRQLATLGGPSLTIVGYPANVKNWRAYAEHDITHDPLAPLTRDRAMVDESDLVVAAPQGFEEIVRGSGTWATIRYARRTNTRLVIVWPDGTSGETYR